MMNRVLIFLALNFLAAIEHNHLSAADGGKTERWRWAPLRCHVQVFPEVDVGNEIHEDVAVVYYTTKSEFRPLEGGMLTAINEAAMKHKIDRSTLPMADELGYVILHDTVADEYYMLVVQERDIVLFMKAECRFSKPRVYQPLYGRRSRIAAFHSEALAKCILAMKNVRVPDEEKPTTHSPAKQ